jgi:hypothetical protein
MAPLSTAPLPTYLRFSDLVARGIVRNRVTLRNWILKYGFPEGHLIGPNSRAWTAEEIADWLAARPSKNTATLQNSEGRHAEHTA